MTHDVASMFQENRNIPSENMNTTYRWQGIDDKVYGWQGIRMTRYTDDKIRMSRFCSVVLNTVSANILRLTFQDSIHPRNLPSLPQSLHLSLPHSLPPSNTTFPLSLYQYPHTLLNTKSPHFSWESEKGSWERMKKGRKDLGERSWERMKERRRDPGKERKEGI